jgi:hypothetical protein
MRLLLHLHLYLRLCLCLLQPLRRSSQRMLV